MKNQKADTIQNVRTAKSPANVRFDVAVIGGGASGLMCAVTASENGAKCVLFEKNRSLKSFASEAFYDNAYLGKKLLITGKGRCNLTNACTSEEFMKNTPRNGKFLYSAFRAMPPESVISFFEDSGVSFKIERGNRVFPVSDRSQDILGALKIRLKRADCTINNKKISSVAVNADKCFSLTDQDGTVTYADKVVICTGGLSYPVTGSTGDGYAFAKAFGHSVTSLRPSLVPLVSRDEFIENRSLQGLSLRNVRFSIMKSEEKPKKIFSEMGELLFTHFGLSGPLVLSASAHIDSDLIASGEYFASIDLKPALDEKTLDNRLLSDFEKYKNRELGNALHDLLPSSIIGAVIAKSELSPSEQPNSISKQGRRRLLETLKDFRISIDGFAPIDEAIITCGGVKTSEINPSTMESKIVKGLYFAGEVIDVDAYTGGFNLQIAFSTGYLAGKSSAEKH